MKAAVFEAAHRLTIQEKPMPVLEAGDVLVQVEGCGVCTSDLMALRGEVTDYSPPVVMGHELAGLVVESRHSRLKVGTKVTLDPMVSCGRCEYCRNDLDKYCPELYGIGHDIDGCYAEYVRVPRRLIENGGVFDVPGDTDSDDLILLEPLGCCLNAMRETHFNESVAILGAGPIGLMFMQLIKERGLQTIVLEPLEHRRQMAELLGADAVRDTGAGEEISDLTDGGVDTVILATNQPEAIPLAYQLARKGAWINFFGLYASGQGIELDIEHLHYTGYKLLASWAFSRWSLGEARKYVIEKRLQLKPLITHRFPIEQTETAFENTATYQGIKNVIVPGLTHIGQVEGER